MGTRAKVAGLGIASLVAFGCAEPPPAQSPSAPLAASGQPPGAPPNAGTAPTADEKAASAATSKANAELKAALPFSDEQDFADAKHGFIGTWDQPTIKDAKGRVVWDFEAFSFLKGAAPPEVNPSLWRMAQLNSIHGLFEVAPSIYQVRGFDLSVMSIIEG